MLNVPNIFPPTPGGPVVQYVGTDIVQGAGYVQFFGSVASSFQNAAQGSFAILTTSKPYSEIISRPADIAANLGNAWLKAGSYQFFTGTFQQSAIIDGTIYAQIPVGIRGSATIGEGHRVRPEIKFFKHKTDGSSEALTDAFSGSIAFTGGATWVSKFCNIPFDVASKAISRGEIIRMQCILWTKANDAGTETPTAYIAHDPQNRSNSTTDDVGWTGAASGNTQLNIFIPFKIDR